MSTATGTGKWVSVMAECELPDEETMNEVYRRIDEDDRVKVCRGAAVRTTSLLLHAANHQLHSTSSINYDYE